MSGTTSKRDKIIKTGTFVYYYENGNKKSITNYRLDKKYGECSEFYDNGNIKEEGEYTGNYVEAGKSYKLNQYWDENKNHLIIDGNGNYSCGNNKGYIETGKYKNGFKDGIYEGKSLKHNTSFIEKYENGKFISGTRTFADNTKSEYSEMETKPVPKRGMDDFYKFIGRNYRMPKIQGLKGKVYITFVVDKEGKIVEPRVLRDLGYGTGVEAVRVVTAYDGFIPGEQRGQKVRCSFSLPISIQSTY
ncbi:MAG: energy transducer TonB [Flavobacterium sp.]|nr:energy transducer TonB [Flavobacterium sp.]